jgi:DNA modification methylase
LTSKSTAANVFTSPKLRLGAETRAAEWYPYYAGYRLAFVTDVLGYLALPPGAHIIDPWAGSGTTGAAAIRAGCRISGFDLNPVLVLIAKARAVGSSVAGSIQPLAIELLEHAGAGNAPYPTSDGLNVWFQPQTAEYLRRLERAVFAVLVKPSDPRLLFDDLTLLDTVSSLAALYYVALFRTVRHFLRDFKSSNPTWIKTPVAAEARLHIEREAINQLFLAAVDALTTQVRLNPGVVSEDACQVQLSDSRRLPVNDRVADACIASPPYCTRIDYVVGSLPELALIGCPNAVAARAIRDGMLGTPTMSAKTPEAQRDWGKTCRAFLKYVRGHNSHASEGYYWRNYLQYFDGLYASLAEINRVLSDRAMCVLVVQDSHYKGRQLDLGTIVAEMAAAMKWRLRKRVEYGCHTLASINRGARQYGSSGRATESVIVLERKGMTAGLRTH